MGLRTERAYSAPMACRGPCPDVRLKTKMTIGRDYSKKIQLTNYRNK